MSVRVERCPCCNAPIKPNAFACDYCGVPFDRDNAKIITGSGNYVPVCELESDNHTSYTFIVGGGGAGSAGGSGGAGGIIYTCGTGGNGYGNRNNQMKKLGLEEKIELLFETGRITEDKRNRFISMLHPER